jgi:hypothetical protein
LAKFRDYFPDQDLASISPEEVLSFLTSLNGECKHRREPAGFSIEEARAAEGKRRAQKIESPGILEKVQSERMTFSDSEDDLHRAMVKYAEWLDSQRNLQSVDHNVD